MNHAQCLPTWPCSSTSQRVNAS
uniref:Uncharacterized protein n=1 Tax=Arundo donax TaxID=35708 RepID=A0A0A8YB84_ARUDO